MGILHKIFNKSNRGRKKLRVRLAILLFCVVFIGAFFAVDMLYKKNNVVMMVSKPIAEKTEVKKLQNLRHKEDAKYAREIMAISAKNERQKEKCDALQTKVKWAKEDLSNAHPKAESKTRLKLKRATEKAALSCKTR